jgi:EAL domain-containing protein (putative c-di-GMP-specific phosphodiesterase class I)
MRRAVAAMAGRPDLHLAVNLSGSSIVDASTVSLLSRLLDEHDVLPSQLTVEVTETVAIHSIDVARGFAQQLADLGCELALDDFGAGFGSFFYLKHLPFTCLKIDGEFIRGMSTSRSDLLTVEAVVKIAQGLGKQTTAEYVADERTYELVRALGIDLAQGYLFGRPAAMDATLGHR